MKNEKRKTKSVYELLGDGPLRNKTADFSLRIINLYKHLLEVYKEYVISKQILRSGTSIGANVAESVYAQSKKDFISKLSIALKETAETEYWLYLLYKSKYISEKEYNSVIEDAEEIRKILISSINTSKKSLSQDDEI